MPKKWPRRSAAAVRTGNIARAEGNSKITNQRLTLPPGFLAKGFSTQTVKKAREKENLHSQERFILEEDLRGITSQISSSTRRSERLCKRNNIEKSSSASPVANSVVNAKKTKFSSKNNSIETTDKSSTNSKSIFKKINQKFLKKNSDEVENLTSKLGTDFCRNLSRKIRARFKRNSLVEVGIKISREITKINKVLSGEIQNNMEPSLACEIVCNEEMIEKPRIELVPRSEWVYETPPRQRIVIPKVEGCQIQPAVICNNLQNVNIYEVKKSVNVNLNKFDTSNVPIDTRFLNHVDSFAAQKIELATSSQICDTAMECETSDNENCNDMMYLNPFFKTISRRPEKTVKKVSKVTELKRHSNNLFTVEMNADESIHDFQKDFEVLDNKGWKTPPFMGSSKEAISEFKRKLFEIDSSPEDGKIFKFPKEAKMFDFSK